MDGARRVTNWHWTRLPLNLLAWCPFISSCWPVGAWEVVVLLMLMAQMKVSGKWPTPNCCFCRHTFSHCFQSRSICFISMFNCQLMTFHLSFACCLARSVFDWQWHLPGRIFSCFTCTDLWLINVCSALTPTHTANYSPASLPCLFLLLLHFACRFCLSVWLFVSHFFGQWTSRRAVNGGGAAPPRRWKQQKKMRYGWSRLLFSFSRCQFVFIANTTVFHFCQ